MNAGVPPNRAFGMIVSESGTEFENMGGSKSKKSNASKDESKTKGLPDSWRNKAGNDDKMDIESPKNKNALKSTPDTSESIETENKEFEKKTAVPEHSATRVKTEHNTILFERACDDCPKRFQTDIQCWDWGLIDGKHKKINQCRMGKGATYGG